MKHPTKPPFSITVILATLTLLFFFWAGFLIHKNLYQTDNQEQSTPIVNSQPDNTPQPEEQTKPSQETIKLANELALKVPFTPQAPTANWDELHNEACEEASSIIAYAYFNNIDALPPKVVEQEITRLTDWQKTNLGYYLSITTKETAQMIEQVYNLKAEVVPMSEEIIKQALNQNQLVIVPAQGQKLGNPYYKPPGPIYHMLVITGYNEKQFITNDPGTKRGLNYLYNYATLYGATGSWDHQTVDTSVKNIIIVYK